MRVPRGETPGDQAAVPQQGTIYWVDTTILLPGDPEAWRPVVVLDVPATVDGTVVVVSRSGVDEYDRRHPVQGRSWTSATVTPVGPLDPDVFAAVVRRFSA